jgi:hypothetical protein
MDVERALQQQQVKHALTTTATDRQLSAGLNVNSGGAGPQQRGTKRTREDDAADGAGAGGLAAADSSDDMESVNWTPPIAQSGDGSTALNRRYGY